MYWQKSITMRMQFRPILSNQIPMCSGSAGHVVPCRLLGTIKFFGIMPKVINMFPHKCILLEGSKFFAKRLDLADSTCYNRCIPQENGVWRSPVAHYNGVVVVGGSNPLTPTDKKAGCIFVKALPALLYALYAEKVDGRTIRETVW